MKTKERVIMTNDVLKKVSGKTARVVKDVKNSKDSEGVLSKFGVSFRKLGNVIFLM